MLGKKKWETPIYEARSVDGGIARVMRVCLSGEIEWELIQEDTGEILSFGGFTVSPAEADRIAFDAARGVLIWPFTF